MTQTTSKFESRHAMPSLQERDALPGKLARELGWYASAPRFQTDAEIKTAIDSGYLLPIPENQYVRPVGKFLKPKPPEGTFAVLSDRGIGGALLLGVQWRRELEKRGINDPNFRLALTSMTRAQWYQNDIVARGILAWPDSTHCVGGDAGGNTFDIDNSAYTLFTEEEGFVPIVDPARHKDDPEGPYYARFRDLYGDYDPAVNQAAEAAANAMHTKGIINRVVELPDTPSGCIHIAVNPVYNFRMAS